MVCRDSARSSFPVASGPSTRRRLASSIATRGPCRRQAMSAPARKSRRAQDSGSRQTSFQPSAYAVSVSRSRSELIDAVAPVPRAGCPWLA